MHSAASTITKQKPSQADCTATRCMETGRIKNTADGFPINQSVDLIKEPGTYLAAACAIISKAVGGSLDFHGKKILSIPHMSKFSAYF